MDVKNEWIMKRLLLFLFVSLLSLSTWAYDFTATNDDGYELEYTIVDGTEYGFTAPACELSYVTWDVHGTLTIPSEVESGGTTYTVIGLGEQCCVDCEMTNIVLPDNLLYIEEYALHSCSDLVSLDVPNSIQYLGKKSVKYVMPSPG